jgi:vitamin B12 transporter
VITGEDIAAQSRPFALDYLTQVPGLAVNQNGPAGTVSGFTLRGLPQQYVRVLVDGIEISDPTAPQVTPSLSNLLAGDIARMEVLKGSQSALYGGQAVAGVIDIRTAVPDAPGVESRVAVEGGSRASWRGAYTLAARGERGDAALTLQGLTTDGFSAAEALDGNTEDDGYETTRASFSTGYYLSDTATLRASGFTQAESGDFDAGPGVGGDAPNTFDADSWGLRLGLEAQALGAEHGVAVSRFAIDRTQVSTFGAFRTEGTRDRVEYLGQRGFGAGLVAQLGADYTREETETRFDGSPNGTLDSWIGGVYAQTIWTPSEPVTVSTALRYDHHSDFGGQPTARVTAAYRTGPGTLLRAALGTGFRPPSTFELSDGFSGNPDLEPEQSVSADVGLEQVFLQGRARASATLFWIEVDDLIEYDFATQRYVQSDGTARSRGLELAGSWAATEAVTLTAGYAYVDAENPDGSPRDRVPTHDLTLGVAAAVTARLTLEGTVQVADGQSDATEVPEGSRDLIGSYALVNVRAAYAVTETAEVYLRAANLFDEQYQTARGYGTSDRAVFAGLSARF